MIFKKAYWNYYMSFQVKSNKDITKAIETKPFEYHVVSSYMAGEVFINKQYEDCSEYEIKDYLENNIPILDGTGRAAETIHGEDIKERVTVYLMCPLVMRLISGEEIVCPVFMYLVNTGLGVIKLRVPMENMNAEPFMTMPLKKWYQSVSLLQIRGTERITVFCDDDYETVNDVVALLRNMINSIFSGHLVSDCKNVCFENIVLVETSKPDINKRSFKEEELKELYHLCFPGNFLEIPSSTVVNSFWRDNHIDIGGIEFVKGDPGRILMFGDVKKLIEANGRDDVEDDLEYMENSFQFSFDWSICIALWRKINEMNFFDVSKLNYHNINYNNAVYIMRENELDSMLDLCPVNCKKVYKLVEDVLNESVSSFRERVNRLTKLEQYTKERYNERRALTLEMIAFVGTAIFGLPGIHETLQLLRNSIWQENGDVFRLFSVDGVAIFLWALVIGVSGFRLLMSFVQYKMYRLK